MDREVHKMISRVDATRVAQTVQTLSSIHTRNACSDPTGKTPGIGTARAWIQKRFQEIPGLLQALDSYDQTGCSAPVRQSNVVAWIPGERHPERLFVIGGHYDSLNLATGNAGDPTPRAPGANDSGSQTALVLETARALAGGHFDATVVFVAFAGEEQGLVGAKAFVKDYPTLFPGSHIEAMFNSDIVGGDKVANDPALNPHSLHQFRLFSPGTPRESSGTRDGTTDNTSPSRGIMRYIGTWGALYVPGMAMEAVLREDRQGRGGDHEAFIGAGIPGVRFVEMNEDFLHQHTPNDLAEYVTPEYTARLAQVVASTVAGLAMAPEAPTHLEVKKLPDDTDTIALSWAAPGAPVDHYVIAGRYSDENAYRRRVALVAGPAGKTQVTVSQLENLGLGLSVAEYYYVSIAAVDAAGHESLFSYPEYRCNGKSCVIPDGALDVTAQTGRSP
jgi:hypothetical protein